MASNLRSRKLAPSEAQGDLEFRRRKTSSSSR
jgi:hypothetical protein